MRAVLVSTYDLGRQPFGLASPAAWLRRAGIETICVDTSREALGDHHLAGASLVAFYLPMHTATRLAGPLIARARGVRPEATFAAYGLYAPLNRDWLEGRGITHVLGPEAEEELVALAQSNSQLPIPDSQVVPRLQFIAPDRIGLPPLARYASLQMPDGTHRVMGSTDATRGCKHLCRHCPIVPVYKGQFRVVPLDVVFEDIASQVGEGARHITFGDPDFFNGPTHARRLVERLATDHPGLTYDVTIKIEHLLNHAEMLPLLRDTGCLFVTSAVESIDDEILARLRKGHTRADFVRAVRLCREAGLRLTPTFIPFNPWTTLGGYVELLDVLETLDLVEDVAPIQLAIRLLITAESPLFELGDVRAATTAFDGASLTWPWRHRDPRVDALQASVMRIVGERGDGSRADAFHAISTLARGEIGLAAAPMAQRPRVAVPRVSEPWYCCAEPVEPVGI